MDRAWNDRPFSQPSRRRRSHRRPLVGGCDEVVRTAEGCRRLTTWALPALSIGHQMIDWLTTPLMRCFRPLAAPCEGGCCGEPPRHRELALRASDVAALCHTTSSGEVYDERKERGHGSPHVAGVVIRCTREGGGERTGPSHFLRAPLHSVTATVSPAAGGRSWQRHLIRTRAFDAMRARRAVWREVRGTARRDIAYGAHCYSRGDTVASAQRPSLRHSNGVSIPIWRRTNICTHGRPYTGETPNRAPKARSGVNSLRAPSKRHRR